MQRKAVTYAQIAIIAEKLATSGETPDVNKIKQQLQIDADDSTIEKYLSRWNKLKKGTLQQKLPFSSKSDLDESLNGTLLEQIDHRNNEIKQLFSLIHATLDSTADAILIIDNAGQISNWNKKFENLFPNSAKLTTENNDWKQKLGVIFDGDVIKLILSPRTKAELNNSEIQLKDNRFFEYHFQPQIVDNKQIGTVWSFRNITEKKHAEELLRLQNRAISASVNGILILDLTKEEFPIVYVNPAFEKITGYAAKEIINKPYVTFLSVDENEAQLKHLNNALVEKKEAKEILHNSHKDGSKLWIELQIAPVPNESGKVTHFIGVMTDITARKKMQDQLTYQATHDKLTGLPNHAVLHDRIQQAINNAKRNHQSIAILLLDIDNFKLINDNYGHYTGDQLIIKIADRLSNSLRSVDTVSRLSGDNFIILINEANNVNNIRKIADKLLHVVAETFIINNKEFNVTGSMGISLFPSDGDDVNTLLKAADMAMFKAKQQGRNTLHFFEKQLHDSLIRRINLENAMHYALERNEYHLVYQPIVELKTQTVKSVEALIRWNNKEFGFIPPDEFIPLAEENGEICAIGDWVLNQASDAIAQLHHKYNKQIEIAVNISAKQFITADFNKFIEKILIEKQIPGHCLELELTERILIDGNKIMLALFKQLKTLGISFSIDDFGTGYSNLNYLQLFPINKLKIDRSFIKNLTEEDLVNPKKSGNAALILAIIALAKNLGLKIIAEGIETKQHYEFLKQSGCELGQGYYFAKPMLFEQLIEYLHVTVKRA